NELMAHTYSHLFRVPTTGLRFFTVYGPWGRPDMALFLFTKAILNNQPIQVFNNGNMVRDFTYIDDIVEGIKRVIDNPLTVNSLVNNKHTPYTIYNIGNASPVRLMDYISAIEIYLGKTAEKTYLPMQPGDVPYSEADVTDLISTLGYKPDTPVTVGIGRFIEWYKEYYADQLQESIPAQSTTLPIN